MRKALTDAELAKLTPPTGFSFHRRPTLARTGVLILSLEPIVSAAEYELRLKGLADWAKTNRLGVTPGMGEWKYLTQGDFQNEAYLTHSWNLSANKPLVRKKNTEGGTCPGCAKPHRFGQIRHECGYSLVCGRCNTFGLPLVAALGGGSRTCVKCSARCTEPGCKEWVALPNRKELTPEKPLCVKHDPPADCWNCGQRYQRSVMFATPEPVGHLCGRCVRFYCTHHRGISTERVGEGIGLSKAKCSDCKFDDLMKVSKLGGKFKPDELPRSGSLVIPALPERPFRTVSVEIEYNSKNAGNVARYLWREGLIESPHIGRYSSQGSVKSQYVCNLKQDGSVTGGELVAYMMNLDDEKHAEAFLRVLEVLNILKEAGWVVFSLNAGGHIHNDAHNFSVGDAFALVTLFNYLEDPIHRIAGAPGPHRSLEGNNHGSAATLKGPFGGKKSFGMTMPKFSRAALNIQHFVRAMNNCECGAARYEAWAECTCVLPKNTIEWRVFNSTGNPRILHGWIAFVQSMVAFSTAYEVNEADFPPMAWTRAAGRNLTDNAKQINDTKERLRWIYTHLPLTADEKDSLLYAIKNSDLTDFVDAAFLDGLLALEPVVEFDMKPVPRNPNRRSIRVIKPKPGSKPPKNPF